jgi:hypothetical protein
VAEKLRVILRSPSADALRDLLRSGPLDLNCGGPRKEPDGSFVLEAFVTRPMVQALQKRSGITVTVDEAFTRTSAARQKEVGTGNRYRDGREIPRGPGRKK